MINEAASDTAADMVACSDHFDKCGDIRLTEVSAVESPRLPAGACRVTSPGVCKKPDCRAASNVHAERRFLSMTRRIASPQPICSYSTRNTATLAAALSIR